MNSLPLVAVASRSFSQHSVLVSELRAKFPNLRLNEAGKSLSGGELIKHLAGAERAVIALERIDASILAHLPDLRVIGKYGVGLDNIDMDAMRAHDVKLGWTGGVNRLGVAELALELMLGGVRKTWESRELAENGGWIQIRGRQLSRKTVGIVGFGHVGKEVARILAPFQVRILVNDIRDVSRDAAAVGAELADKDRIFAEADVITLHTPKTQDTTRMINARALSIMKPNAVVVNTARGGLIDERALYSALTENRIGAAAVDVFETEPPGDNPLIKLTNFAATTHIGGSSEEAVLNMGRAAITGLENAVDAVESNFY